MKALIIVDVQNDFCAGGTLEVTNGNSVIPTINQIVDKFDYVFASKDWHPKISSHFEKWPVHCVQNTFGAELQAELKVEAIDYIMLKGTNGNDDGYSAFEATNLNLEELLRKKNINSIYVCGLATDYCVKNTVLDALKKGFNTYLVTDAVKPVSQNIHEVEGVLKEMQNSGCLLIESQNVN